MECKNLFKEKLKILVADDHPIALNGVKTLLENWSGGLYIVEEACNGEEALEKIKKFMPNIIILDLTMPKLDGLETLKYIKKNFQTKVVILTMRDEISFIKAAQKLGADAYVLKISDSIELINAIQKVQAEEKYFCSKTIEILSKAAIDDGSFSKSKSLVSYLTPRELEIIKYIAQGMTSQQIAERLAISYFTVSQHRKNILAKLKLKTPAELTKFAIEYNLID